MPSPLDDFSRDPPTVSFLSILIDQVRQVLLAQSADQPVGRILSVGPNETLRMYQPDEVSLIAACVLVEGGFLRMLRVTGASQESVEKVVGQFGVICLPSEDGSLLVLATGRPEPPRQASSLKPTLG